MEKVHFRSYILYDKLTCFVKTIAWLFMMSATIGFEEPADVFHAAAACSYSSSASAYFPWCVFNKQYK